MCGITGIISSNPLKKATISSANYALAHRGPDAGGLFTDESQRVILGHRRLSILDLSDIANQPMHSACQRFVMVYNGEVYNFRALQKKLPDFSWKTQSDTEVILELFAAFGIDCFKWLEGMFALAIYDKRDEKLFMARDQTGIKPLFYYHDETKFVFASELKAIKAYAKTEVQKLEINRIAVAQFLHLGFIPEPATIYKQVYKFPAAHYGIISPRISDLTLARYWNVQDHFLTHPIRSESEALPLYKELLYSAIGDQMVSDVPLGTFLSGGIDSSLVSAIASKISDKKINTFSIGFKDSRYDESAYAKSVAINLGTHHHELKVSSDDVLELIPSLLDVYDEPFADSSAFPTMLVSQLARKHVTVALSGDGGDELFQGYGMYAWANRLDNPLLKLARKPIYSASKLMGDRYKRVGKLFDYSSSAGLKTHIFSQEQYYFSEKELSDLLTEPDFKFNNINNILTSRNANAGEKQALWDFEHYLKDDLLVKVDRASMHYSLETRVPLLDQRLVEFAFNLDYGLKVKNNFGRKYLMKKVLYEMVPSTLFDRPKRGFSIPLESWLKGPLSWMIDQYLTEKVISSYSYVRYQQVAVLIKKFRSGQAHLYNRIWTLIVLHWWLEKQECH